MSDGIPELIVIGPSGAKAGKLSCAYDLRELGTRLIDYTVKIFIDCTGRNLIVIEHWPYPEATVRVSFGGKNT